MEKPHGEQQRKDPFCKMDRQLLFYTEQTEQAILDIFEQQNDHDR